MNSKNPSPIFENSSILTADLNRHEDGEDSSFGDPNHPLHQTSTEDMMGRMGQAFVNARKLTQDQVIQIIRLQRKSRIRFGEAAIRLGLLTETDVHEVLEQQFNYHTAANQSANQPHKISAELDISHAPYSAAAESMRRFRSEILLRTDDKQSIAVAIISPSSKEGKSHLAASLAIAFSQLNMKTLLIDANLRKPVQHQNFGIQNRNGLSSLLAGRSSISTSATSIINPYLHILTAGPKPPNPIEILSAPHFIELLDFFAQDFQVIIIDTPATSMGSDAQIISQQIGMAILVCRENFTHIELIKKAERDMQTANVQLLGVYFNNVNRSSDQTHGGNWFQRLLGPFKRPST